MASSEEMQGCLGVVRGRRSLEWHYIVLCGGALFQVSEGGFCMALDMACLASVWPFAVKSLRV